MRSLTVAALLLMSVSVFAQETGRPYQRRPVAATNCVPSRMAILAHYRYDMPAFESQMRLEIQESWMKEHWGEKYAGLHEGYEKGMKKEYPESYANGVLKIYESRSACRRGDCPAKRP